MRRVGGAHRGIDMWLMQRASALYMALFLPIFMAAVMYCGAFGYAGWRAMFVPLPMKLATLLFVAALLVHGWIGMREIGIDYVQHLGVRLIYYFIFAMLYLACLAWTVAILWSI